jgi:hypothetical protein
MLAIHQSLLGAKLGLVPCSVDILSYRILRNNKFVRHLGGAFKLTVPSHWVRQVSIQLKQTIVST